MQSNYQILMKLFRQRANDLFGEEAVNRLEEHFKSHELTLPASYRKQFPVMLMILANTASLMEAVEVFHERTGIQHFNAERMFIDAVNAAPKDWQDQQEKFLFDRGITRGLEGFHKGRKEELEYRLQINTIMQSVSENAKSVILAAVDASHMHKNRYDVTMKDRALLYIAVQMIENPAARAILLASFRKEHGGVPFKLAINSAVGAIQKIAPVLGIDLESLPKLYSLEKQPKTSVVAVSPAEDMARVAEQPEPVEPVAIVPQDELERLGLEEALDDLVVMQDITLQQKAMYLYAVTPRHDGKLPSEAHIVSKFITRVGPGGSQQTFLSIYDVRKWMPHVVQQLAKTYDSPPANPLVLKP